jgi:hypothetical protein
VKSRECDCSRVPAAHAQLPYFRTLVAGAGRGR